MSHKLWSWPLMEWKYRLHTSSLRINAHIRTHVSALNWVQMHKHSQAVFSASAHPLTPSGPPPLTFTPQACIPSIVDSGATWHVTDWIKPHSGPHAERSDNLSAFSTCIVRKQTLTLTFSVHPGKRPSSRDASIHGYFHTVWRFVANASVKLLDFTVCFYKGKAVLIYRDHVILSQCNRIIMFASMSMKVNRVFIKLFDAVIALPGFR